MENTDPRMFINRELSALAFNLRILSEAQDAALPTYERVRFLSIASANLDEFFMVRVAGIKQQLASGVTATEADGLSPTEQFQAITAEVRDQVRLFDAIWRDELMPLLRSNGVELLAPDALDRAQRDAAKEHFRTVVFPALTPLAVDPGHPFPTSATSRSTWPWCCTARGGSVAREAARATWRWCRCLRCSAGLCRSPPPRVGARTSSWRTSSACSSGSCSPASPWSTGLRSG